MIDHELIDRLYKDKYKISYCNFCNKIIITCPICKNSSCNGGGCESCNEDFDYFLHDPKFNYISYLSENEFDIYRKVIRLQSLMMKSISNYDKVDFEQLKNEEYITKKDEVLVSDYIKNYEYTTMQKIV